MNTGFRTDGVDLVRVARADGDRVELVLLADAVVTLLITDRFAVFVDDSRVKVEERNRVLTRNDKAHIVFKPLDSLNSAVRCQIIPWRALCGVKIVAHHVLFLVALVIACNSENVTAVAELNFTTVLNRKRLVRDESSAC